MSNIDAIPFVDLKAQYASLKDEMDREIATVITNTDFIKGPTLAAFEAAFAERLGVAAGAVIGCANGTASVTLALRGAGVKPGDEVILPSHTFFATVESVVNVGAVPVFVDIRASDYTLDPEAVEAALTEKTSAILPVHIYGTPCDMGKLQAICASHDLALIEDCAQAHLAQWDGQTVSTIGDAAGFSFYPGKNLGAYGDAGATIVRDKNAAENIRRYVDHGRTGKYESAMIGDNLRMDTLQAKVLSVKLPHLPNWTQARRDIAARYDTRLQAAGFKVITPDAKAKAVYHLYIVEVANRDEVQAALKAQGIATGVHYPIPCHQQPAMKTAEHRVSGSLAVTEQIVENILSLPVFPELTEAQQDRVISCFLEVAKPTA